MLCGTLLMLISPFRISNALYQTKESLSKQSKHPLLTLPMRPVMVV